jgi:hypothetical protein
MPDHVGELTHDGERVPRPWVDSRPAPHGHPANIPWQMDEECLSQVNDLDEYT